jgi:hypothetical protein
MEREREVYYGTEFIHVGVIFQKKIIGNIFVSQFPYIIIRIGNEQWSVRSFEIWIFKWPRLISSFIHFPEISLIKYSLKPSLNRFKNIMIQRARHAYNYETYKKWFYHENSPIFWKTALFLLSITPRFFIKSIIHITVKLKKINEN